MQKNDTHEGHQALDYSHNSLFGHVTNRTVLLHVIASTLRNKHPARGQIYHQCHLINGKCGFKQSKWLPGVHLRSDYKFDDTRWKCAKKCPSNVFWTKSPTCIVFELESKTWFSNIQNGHRAAILDLITKSMSWDERVLKTVVIMDFEPKALHA